MVPSDGPGRQLYELAITVRVVGLRLVARPGVKVIIDHFGLILFVRRSFTMMAFRPRPLDPAVILAGRLVGDRDVDPDILLGDDDGSGGGSRGWEGGIVVAVHAGVDRGRDGGGGGESAGRGDVGVDS